MRTGGLSLIRIGSGLVGQLAVRPRLGFGFLGRSFLGRSLVGRRFLGGLASSAAASSAASGAISPGSSVSSRSSMKPDDVLLEHLGHHVLALRLQLGLFGRAGDVDA